MKCMVISALALGYILLGYVLMGRLDRFLADVRAANRKADVGED